MATELVYMNDFDVTTCDAQVVSVQTTENGRTAIVLDQTCFYPRGGGQDWDTGVLAAEGVRFVVEEVRLDETGTVQHIGTFEQGSFEAGSQVQAKVDSARRTTNTRLHSAGHLVDLAVSRLGYAWVPGKGAHYPHMSFVEYGGDFPLEQAEQIQQDIQRTMQAEVAKGIGNEIRFMPVSEMHTVCRHVPPNIPTNKPARVVVYCGDFGVPCGGTHVKSLADIGEVTVTKVKSKKGVVKVSYAIKGIST